MIIATGKYEALIKGLWEVIYSDYHHETSREMLIAKVSGAYPEVEWDHTDDKHFTGMINAQVRLTVELI